MSQDNPFSDHVEPNQARVHTNGVESARIDTASLADYNPFEASASALTGRIAANPNFPTSYSTLEAQLSATSELERRQKELDAKAAELSRREEEQNRLAAQHGPSNNWPPLPRYCPCKPCFYQNVELEIVYEYQKIVSMGYFLWFAYSCLILLNILGALIYFAGTSEDNGGSLFGMSILGLLCIPLSYLCWFRRLYKAFKNNSSINFFIFFFVMAGQILVMIIQSLGLGGSCGWITGLRAVKHPGIAAFIFILASLFTVVTVASTFYLIRVHRIYRSTGASFGKAREEFTRTVVSDPTIQTAVARTLADSR